MWWLCLFFWTLAFSGAALALALGASLALHPINYSRLIIPIIFGIFLVLIARQALRDRELQKTKGDIFYALTDKSFLIILPDTRAVRRYGPRAFGKIRVRRPKRPGGNGAILFRWQRRDIGGRYTETLHPTGDPAVLAELLRQQFGAKVRP